MRHLMTPIIVLTVACSGSAGPNLETLAIPTTSLPNAGENLEYRQTVLSVGGDGRYSWIVKAGILPQGLTLDSRSGEISGRPTTAGTQNFTLQVQSGDGQTAQQVLSLTVSSLLGTIEWTFKDTLPRETLPDSVVVETFYNGYYNPPPCVNANTALADVSMPWNSSAVTHRYDADDDPGFVGFRQGMLNGTDEDLGLGVRQVSGWGVKESTALDSGAPDLAGKTIDFIQLVVDNISRSGSAPSFGVVIHMRWLVYGR